MGGLVFAGGDRPLLTPRMPKEVYEKTTNFCHAELQRLFHYVETPIEGPSKKDFGDIDIFVAGPKFHYNGEDEGFAYIYNTLQAEGKIIEKGNGASAHFALKWPTEDHDYDSRPLHIQVDVRIFDSPDELHWMMFKHGHGDLWNLVGSTIRPYGLTVDDSALWLRVPEIEESNKKRARIFLSSNPTKVLDFIGLKDEGFWDRPFDSMDELYEYAASCRLMYVSPTELEPDSKKLKANDRRRMSYRPVFKQWVDGFLPECRRTGRFASKPTTREAVAKEAFAVFGVEAEFKARRDEFLLERQKDHIWNHVIKDNIPQPTSTHTNAIMYRSRLAKALKRIILEDDATYGIVPEESLKDANGGFIMDKVITFVKTHQKQVGDVAMTRQNAEYAEHMRNKQKKASES